MNDPNRRGRVTAGDRVRRLLSIVPWIAAREGPTIEEICTRFGLTRAQLLADLDVVFIDPNGVRISCTIICIIYDTTTIYKKFR